MIFYLESCNKQEDNERVPQHSHLTLLMSSLVMLTSVKQSSKLSHAALLVHVYRAHQEARLVRVSRVTCCTFSDIS